MTPLQPSVFTIEIGGKPILSFTALNIREAHELCREEWLRADLIEATSEGTALWDEKATIRARVALADEAAEVATASLSTKPSDGLLLVYHVALDTA